MNAVKIAFAFALICIYTQSGEALKCYFCEGKNGSGDSCDVVIEKTHSMDCHIFVPRSNGGLEISYQCVALRKGDKVERTCSIKDFGKMKYCEIFRQKNCEVCDRDYCNTNELL